jgi:hypothetical protein
MKNLTSKLIVVVASAIVVVGCGKSSPNGPSPLGPGTGTAYALRGEVAEPGMDGAVASEGATAVVSNGSLESVAVTDAQGVFRVDGLEAGDWTVTLSKAGFMDQTLQITVTADAYVSCMLERDPNATEQRKPARIRR